jgi:uncharacterized membrane protein YqjE
MFSADSIKEAFSKFFKLDSLKENLSGYIEARVALLKMEVREDVAKVITRALVFGVIAFLGLLFIVFLSLGLALFINRYFQESYVGFYIVAGFYLLLFLIAIVFKKEIYNYLEHVFKDKLEHKK